MVVSLIHDSRVRDDKSGDLSHVDLEVSPESMRDLAELLTAFHVCPGVFVDQKRIKTVFQSIQLVSFDFDDGTLVEEIRSRVERWNHVIAASKNHMKDKGDGKGIVPRFHLFLGLDRPIHDAHVYSVGVEYLKRRFGLNGCDKSVKDVTRYFFRHPEILSLQASAAVYPAQLLETEADRRFRPPKKAPTFRPSPARVEGGDFRRTQYYRLLVEGGLRADGERQQNCLRILGAMRTSGLSKEEARELIHAHAEWGQSFTVSRVDGMLRSFWR
jgi:hypothetical protein